MPNERQHKVHKYIRKVLTPKGNYRYIYADDDRIAEKKRAIYAKEMQRNLDNLGKTASEAFLNKYTANRNSTKDAFYKQVDKVVDTGKKWVSTFFE